jgi:hypothetical protein
MPSLPALPLAELLECDHGRHIERHRALPAPGLDPPADDLARHDRPRGLRSADEDLAALKVDPVPAEAEHVAAPQPVRRQPPRRSEPIVRGDIEECG